MTPIARILRVAETSPERPALEIGGRVWSYRALITEAAALAERLPEWKTGQTQPRMLVAVERHPAAYIAILAAHLRGYAYVPIDPGHPHARNTAVLAAAEACCITSSPHIAADVARLLQQLPQTERSPAQEICTPGEADTVPLPTAADMPKDMQALAYILFTSGSTGTPKGVPISQGNLAAYLDAVEPVLPVAPGDRLSQTFALTFDLSVHDMFVALSNSATLVVPTHDELQDPADYINERRITHWFSVPSLAYQMRLRGALREKAFPSLRSVLFCGEILSWELGRDWIAAAPNARIENWYGPTEATIACARFPLQADPLPVNGNVPIGTALDGMTLHALDDELAPVAEGVAGELYLSGPQLASGYLNDPEKTSAAFVVLPDGTRAYRSGDRVTYMADGVAQFLGRVDNQVKLRGYRIELSEVETQLRSAAKGANALALPWPKDVPTALIAVIEGETVDADAILDELKTALPDYMLPASVHAIPVFPSNASGKADRKALFEVMERKIAGEESPVLSPRQSEVMDAILSVAPALSPARITQASNLLEAGMDSLAFVSFTMEVERRYGVSLDQAAVVRLSETSFDGLVTELTGPRRGVAGWVARLTRALRTRLRSRRLRPRANRALQFIERLDDALQHPGPPVVMAVGSSGVFRSFSPEVFQREATQLGHAVRPLNVGLPAVDMAGLRKACEFIRDRCQVHGIRMPLVLWEFDPMLVSVSPPKGDVGLGPEFFSGAIKSRPPGSVDPEFEWRPENGGLWEASADGPMKARRPNWARERDTVVASAYMGRLEMVPQMLSQWHAAAQALAQVSERVVCFVHPPDPAMMAEMEDRGEGPYLRRELLRIRGELGIEVLDWERFDLEPEDFMDINHTNAQHGRGKLTQQIARRVLSSAPGQKDS